MSRLKLPLLEEQTTDGDGAIQVWRSSGPGTFHVFGDWDGATVTITGSADGTNFDEPSGAIFTDDTIEEFEAGELSVKATISSAGALTKLTAYLVPQSIPR